MTKNTNWNFKQKLIPLAVATAIAVAPLPAMATPAGEAAIVSAIVTMQVVVTGVIQKMIASILDVTTKMQSAQQAVDAAMQRQTIKAVADAQNMAEEERVMRFKSADLARDMAPPPFVCQTAAAGDQMSRSNAAAVDLTDTMTRQLARRSANTNNSIMAADQIANERRQIGEDKYDQVVNATTLLNRKTYTQDEEKAAQIFIRNVVDPTPVPALPANFKDTPGGREMQANLTVRNNMLSIASNSLTRIFADRKSVAASGTNAGLNKADLSAKELADAEVDKRFALPAWKEGILAATSAVTVLKELTIALGFSVQQEQKAYEQMERIEALLAADMSQNVRRRDSELLAARSRLIASNATNSASR